MRKDYPLKERNLRDRNRIANIWNNYRRDWKRVLTKDKSKVWWVVLEAQMNSEAMNMQRNRL